MPDRCPELFVEEDAVTVGGDLKFSRGVQDLKEREPGLREVAQTCVYNSVFCLPSADLPMGHPFLAQSFSFPVGSWGREGNL